MKSLGIIPARYASSRFPGKPLAEIGGQSMISRVYAQASKAALLDAVAVATDDARIFEHVSAFGGKVAMTGAGHPSGTDRCAELARRHPEYEIIVNIQGDEPFIDPAQIDAVVAPLQNGAAAIATLARRVQEETVLSDANVVKVVVNRRQEAMYFSRSAIPFARQAPAGQWLSQAPYYQHIGLYGFRRETLLAVTELPPSDYEKAEALEQLRWLEAGYIIFVSFTGRETLGVDTPADLAKAEAWLRRYPQEK